jgi:ribulose 1,5-bisphosphate synthetase/thiazole synthase
VIDAGAPVLDPGADVVNVDAGGVGTRFPTDLRALSASRDLLEWAVRRRVADLPSVRFIQGVDVTGLIPNAAGAGIAGVAIRHRGEGDPEVIDAGLVVDASGRGSALDCCASQRGAARDGRGRGPGTKPVHRRPANFADD